MDWAIGPGGDHATADLQNQDAKEHFRNMQIECLMHAHEHGVDRAGINSWKWPDSV